MRQTRGQLSDNSRLLFLRKPSAECLTLVDSINHFIEATKKASKFSIRGGHLPLFDALHRAVESMVKMRR